MDYLGSLARTVQHHCRTSAVFWNWIFPLQHWDKNWVVLLLNEVFLSDKHLHNTLVEVQGPGTYNSNSRIGALCSLLTYVQFKAYLLNLYPDYILAIVCTLTLAHQHLVAHQLLSWMEGQFHVCKDIFCFLKDSFHEYSSSSIHEAPLQECLGYSSFCTSSTLQVKDRYIHSLCISNLAMRNIATFLQQKFNINGANLNCIWQIDNCNFIMLKTDNVV